MNAAVRLRLDTPPLILALTASFSSVFSLSSLIS